MPSVGNDLGAVVVAVDGASGSAVSVDVVLAALNEVDNRGALADLADIGPDVGALDAGVGLIVAGIVQIGHTELVVMPISATR